MQHKPRILLCISLILASFSQGSQAHFLWLLPQSQNGSTVHVVFSEGPVSGESKLLQKISGVQVEAFVSEDDSVTMPVAFSDEQRILGASHAGATAWRLNHTYGVVGAETKSLLVYHAQSIPCGWEGLQESDRVAMPAEGFQLDPRLNGKQLTLTLTFNGKPSIGTAIELQTPTESQSLVTDANGQVMIERVEPGVMAIRCSMTEETPGTHEGKTYAAIKHYTTVSFLVPDLMGAVPMADAGSLLPELPEAITSFGATVQGDQLFVYGGHTGGAHSYSNEEQFNRLIRLDLNEGDSKVNNSKVNKEWKTIAEGPRVQGNALVGYAGNVILVGGFSAENKTGEKARLVSQSEAMLFDTKSDRWIPLPNLPEPRSSMDATVLGDHLYVFGGWTMTGNSSDAEWLKTAWKLPLTGSDPQWQPLAAPPFERRAVATIGHANRIFVIGGMDSDGSPTTACDVYDPATNQWSKIDALAGVPLNGFGAAAVEVGGRLIVSTVDGSLQEWNDAASRWEIRGCMPTGRFFHRAVPIGSDRFALLGGANMNVGKFKEVEIVALRP